jgi:hypothetical protein
VGNGANCDSASPTSTVTFTAQQSSGGLPSSCAFTHYNIGNTTPISSNLAVIGQSIPVTTDITVKPALGGANMFMAQIVVPKGTANGTHTLSYANYGGPTANRMVYASTTPCLMTGKQLVSASQSGSFKMKVAATSGVSGTTVSMKAGDTWYVMIVDYSQDLTRGSATFGLPTKSSCSGACPGLVVFQ